MPTPWNSSFETEPSFVVTVDRTQPVRPTLVLDSDFDIGTLGDFITTIPLVMLTGQTEGDATVELLEMGHSTVANANGNF